MIVIIAKTFRDKDDFDKIYLQGEEHDFSPERVSELEELGLVNVITDDKESKTKAKK